MKMEQRSEEWFLARKNRITASMVGAILGLSPYMTRSDAMRAMVRAREGAETEFKGNVATEHGTFHEDGARFEYEMETTHTVTPCGFIEYEDWAGASLDALIGETGLLEIKCPFGLRKDEAPIFKPLADQPHYHAQVQFQLFCTGRKWAHFFQWAPHGTKLETVQADADWLNEHIPRLRQFHAEFLEEPADDHLAPLRVTIDTPQASKMVAEWDELAEAIERATERKKDLLAEMVALAGDKNAILSGRKLTMTKRAGAVSYAKALKAIAPDADLTPYTGKPSEFWGLK